MIHASSKRFRADSSAIPGSKEQLATLHTMEQFQWELRFVRRPMFLAPVPVLFNRDGTRFAVLEADGSINENPGFKIRP